MIIFALPFSASIIFNDEILNRHNHNLLDPVFQSFVS
jgi:hypothetical protein